MARMTRTCHLANAETADARVPGPPASAAVLASAEARVIDEVHAGHFLTGLANRTVTEARPDKHGELPPVTVVNGRVILGAVILYALLDGIPAT